MNVGQSSQRFAGQYIPALFRTFKRGSASSTGVTIQWGDVIKTAPDNNIVRCYVDSTCSGDFVLHDRPQNTSAKLRQPKGPGTYQRLNFQTIKVHLWRKEIKKSPHCAHNLYNDRLHLRTHSSVCSNASLNLLNCPAINYLIALLLASWHLSPGWQATWSHMYTRLC